MRELGHRTTVIVVLETVTPEAQAVLVNEKFIPITRAALEAL